MASSCKLELDRFSALLRIPRFKTLSVFWTNPGNIFCYKNGIKSKSNIYIRYLNTNIWFSIYEYMRYLYSARLWRKNIFNICIRPGPKNEYITNIFEYVSGTKFPTYAKLANTYSKIILYLYENATKLVKPMRSRVVWARAGDCFQYKIFFFQVISNLIIFSIFQVVFILRSSSYLRLSLSQIWNFRVRYLR